MTADETMIFWQGTGSAHLTYIPRKPTPLGIMLKTLVDTSSGVLLNAELMEAADDMRDKEYVKEWGQTTATTLRLTSPYQGKGKVLIIDSWFGSTRTAYSLKHLQGTYTIANVKQNSRGFPKKELLESCPERGDTASMSVQLEDVTMWASCHRDKQPMSLIHTCDTMLRGAPRFRTFLKYSKGKVTRRKFTLEQPSVHARYRSTFWAVDRYNKLALGPDSV